MHHHGSYDLGDEAGDFPCVLLDISETGALLGNVRPVDPGASIDLDIPGIGILPAQVVRCTESNVAIEFSGPSEAQRLRIIDFIDSSSLSNEVKRLGITQVIHSLFTFLLGIPGPSPHPRSGGTAPSPVRPPWHTAPVSIRFHGIPKDENDRGGHGLGIGLAQDRGR